jgi:hypothetical protein
MEINGITLVVLVFALFLSTPMIVLAAQREKARHRARYRSGQLERWHPSLPPATYRLPYEREGWPIEVQDEFDEDPPILLPSTRHRDWIEPDSPAVGRWKLNIVLVGTLVAIMLIIVASAQ